MNILRLRAEAPNPTLVATQAARRGHAMGSMAPVAVTSRQYCRPCTLIVTLALAASTPSCCGGRLLAPNPIPSVTSLTPSSVTAGAAAFTLTVNGANFISTSTVQWNGSKRPTSYVSATQLTTSIAAADIAIPTYVAVTVANPAPGGGTSASVGITPLWSKPAHGIDGLLVDASTDLTSRMQLNSFGGPLFAAWNPTTATATGPGMHIVMFGTPVASCPPHSQGPMSSFSDAVLTADGYPGRAAAVPKDMRFEPTPMATCTSAAAIMAPKSCFSTARRRGSIRRHLETQAICYYSFRRMDRMGKEPTPISSRRRWPTGCQVRGSTIQPWALNGRARLATLAQVVRIRARDTAYLTQTKQEIAVNFINTACSRFEPDQALPNLLPICASACAI
jgi:hypothetical protein